jgi:hypothetical protein
VVDIGNDPDAKQKVLDGLASENVTIFEITHLTADDALHIHGDQKVYMEEIQTARGVKYGLTCSGAQRMAPAVIRAGADSFTAPAETIAIDAATAYLSLMAGYLEQYANSAQKTEMLKPSVMDFALRLKTLIEPCGGAACPLLVPTSDAIEKHQKVG